MRNHERRRSTRVRVVALASIETRGALDANDQALGAVRDMSKTGIGLETGQPPRRGQTVLLRIAIDDAVRELRALVTRVQRRGNGHFYDVGLDWSMCSAADLVYLDEVVSAFGTPRA